MKLSSTSIKTVGYILLILTLFGQSACETLLSKRKKTPITTKAGESVIENDATPPPGYSQRFITSVDSFSADTTVNYTIDVINTEVGKGKVRVLFNLSDSINKAYLYANLPKWKGKWCLVEEKIDTFVRPVVNYELKHFNENDSLPNAFAFVLDHSGSMGDKRARIVQEGIAMLINDNKRPEDAYTIVKYDDNIVQEVGLSSDKSTILSNFRRNGLDGYGGYTAINDGLSYAVNVLDNSTGYAYKSVVIFTDGQENASKTNVNDVIADAKRKNIKVFSIDFGEGVDTTYMSNIARGTGGKYYHIYGSHEFKAVFRDIYIRMKNLYILEYTPTMFGEIQLKFQLCNDNDKAFGQSSFSYKPEIGNIALVNVYFDKGKFIVKKLYEEEIERFAAVMRSYPAIKIEIRGHTDDEGSEKSNEILSENRANAVMKSLISKGIDASRLTSKGFGETLPVSDNSTKEGKALNRRTEFVIIGN